MRWVARLAPSTCGTHEPKRSLIIHVSLLSPSPLGSDEVKPHFPLGSSFPCVAGLPGVRDPSRSKQSSYTALLLSYLVARSLLAAERSIYGQERRPAPVVMGEQLEAPLSPAIVDQEPPPASVDEKQRAPPPAPAAADNGKAPAAFFTASMVKDQQEDGPPSPKPADTPPKEDKDKKQEAQSPPPLRFPVLVGVSQWALTSACVFAVFGAYASTLPTPCASSLWWCHELTGADALLPRLAWRAATQAAAAALAVLIPGRRRVRWLLAFAAYWATATNLYRFAVLVGLIYAGTNRDLLGAFFAVAGGLYLFVAAAMALMSPGALISEYQVECRGLPSATSIIVAAMVKKRNRFLYYRLEGLYGDMKVTDQPRSMVQGVACWALLTGAAYAVLAAYINYLLTPCPVTNSTSWWWWPWSSCQELTGADADLARRLLPRLMQFTALQAGAAAMALALLLLRRYRSSRAVALVALAAAATNHCRLARLLGPVLDAWGEPFGAYVAGMYVFFLVPSVAMISLIVLAVELVRGPLRWWN
ncbi:hypothetical protein EJB05_56242, partial [Eragrostis curvula]